MKKTVLALSFFAFMATKVAFAAPIQITANELYKEYDKNEVRADNLYKGKQLLISGKVESIASNLFDDPEVYLSVSSLFGHVSADFKKSQKDRVIALDKGQSVTLLCTGAGEILGFPLVENCEFANSSGNSISTSSRSTNTQNSKNSENGLAERLVSALEKDIKQEFTSKANSNLERELGNLLAEAFISGMKEELADSKNKNTAKLQAVEKTSSTNEPTLKSQKSLVSTKVAKAENTYSSASADSELARLRHENDKIERELAEIKTQRQQLQATQLKNMNTQIDRELAEIRAQKQQLQAAQITSNRSATSSTYAASGSNSADFSKLDIQEGLAKYQDSNGLYGFMDSYGNVVISPRYKGAGGFYNGRAVVKDRSSELWGYIDKSANWVVKPQFCMAGRFSEGLAGVYFGGSKSGDECIGGKWGFIDPTGKMVITAKYDRVWAFSKINGVPMAKFEHGSYTGYINKKGEWVK